MKSIWIDSVEKIESSGELNDNINTEVCIVGAGITGITTAYYLVEKGYKVVVIEKEDIANGVTGYTTAKVTSEHGLIYHYLLEQYGLEFAKKYFEANESAIKNIKRIIDKNKIECDFEFKDSYVYTSKESELPKIKEEAKALKKINAKASETNEVSLPFKILDAIKFENQAQFNPLKYIKGLTEHILEKGGKIYTNTLCIDIKKEDEDYVVYANKKIHAKYVVLACQYPFLKIPGLYFAKMYQSSSYVIGVDTKDSLPNGMYISVESPIYSFRTAKINDKEILLLGGAGHKTGEKTSYEESYGALEKRAKNLYPNSEILYKWSTRDAVTLDKIPYIGEYSMLMPNVYIATGFNKWGMTSSNVAANIIVDKIDGVRNEYEEVFRATRVHPVVNKDEVKNMVVESTKSLVGGRFKKEKLKIEDIELDSGGIVDVDGEKVGVYIDENGEKYFIKPVCTHLGCILEWNDADKTWDCPCHGSRFSLDGELIKGPAITSLTKK